CNSFDFLPFHRQLGRTLGAVYPCGVADRTVIRSFKETTHGNSWNPMMLLQGLVSTQPRRCKGLWWWPWITRLGGGRSRNPFQCLVPSNTSIEESSALQGIFSLSLLRLGAMEAHVAGPPI
ncbi:hypothetical protein PIB30_050131, partial [Stylosanthes scabra]|nr:hypothetical protein [Stylosanthes scabra]